MSSSDMPEPQFTMNELLEEIAGLDQDVDLGEALTTREMMPLFGVRSQKSVRLRIRPLVYAGVLVVTSKTIKNMAGHLVPVTAYAVNPTATWEDLKGAIGGGQ